MLKKRYQVTSSTRFSRRKDTEINLTVPQYVQVRTFQNCVPKSTGWNARRWYVAFSSPTNNLARCSSASGHILLVLQGTGTSPQCITEDLCKSHHLAKVQYGPRKYKVPCTMLSRLHMHRFPGFYFSAKKLKSINYAISHFFPPKNMLLRVQTIQSYLNRTAKQHDESKASEKTCEEE